MASVLPNMTFIVLQETCGRAEGKAARELVARIVGAVIVTAVIPSLVAGTFFHFPEDKSFSLLKCSVELTKKDSRHREAIPCGIQCDCLSARHNDGHKCEEQHARLLPALQDYICTFDLK
jgi:hypothetical protein